MEEPEQEVVCGRRRGRRHRWPVPSPRAPRWPTKPPSRHRRKIGKHTWEVAPDPITDIAETYDFDVVVVGGGMAGMGAAEAAARFGASVAVVERSEKGRSCGMDMCAIGSKVLLEAGSGDIDPLEAARLMYSASQQTANYNLIHTWATQTAGVIDYITDLCAANGVKVETTAGGGTAKAGWDAMPDKYVVLQDAVRYNSDNAGLIRSDGNEPHQILHADPVRR